MKLFKLFFFLFPIACSTHAQNDNFENEPNQFSAHINWTDNPIQKHIQNGVVFTAKLEKCNNPSIGMEKDYVLLTLNNNNLNEVVVSLHQNLYFDGVCKTCLSDEYNRKYTISGKAQISGSCSSHSSEGLKLFYGSPWVSEELTKFELADIKIKKQ